MQKIIKVFPCDRQQRLDKFLWVKLESFSRSQISGLIKKGTILVDGKKSKPGFTLKGGETIKIKIETAKQGLKPYAFPVNIIFEDEWIIVVDKPYGLTVHPPQADKADTLVNALIHAGKKLSSLDDLRPGIVHRLDKETSGLMVLAKDNSVHESLVTQFKERKIEKAYKAIVWGVVAFDKLDVDLPLTRDTKNRLKMRVGAVGGKSARTRLEVEKRFSDATLLSLCLETGRMHQIRVHLNFLGYPVVGDQKYGGVRKGYNRLLLHACELGFSHPLSGDFIRFKSELPPRFQDFIKERS